MQMETKLADKKANLSKILSMIDEAAKQNVKLAVFPECALTGFSCGQEYLQLSEPIPGPTTEIIGKKTKEHSMYVVVGMPEKGKIEGVLHNSAALIGPEGTVVAKYSKSHLALYLHWGDIICEEQEIFRKGNELSVFKTELGNIGILICQDSDFPETWRVLGLKGADIVLFPSASPPGFSYMWYNELSAMAFQNGFYIIATNKVGKENYEFHGIRAELVSFGGSIIVDPLGRIVKQAKEFREEIIVAEIDTDEVAKARWDTKLLRDRRPELYGAITEMR